MSVEMTFCDLLTREEWDAYEKEKAERKLRLAANREMHEACCDPEVASAYEMRKPVYHWTVNATWSYYDGQGVSKRKESLPNVLAQNERDAWANFCDHLDVWPNRQNATVEFIRGEQADPTAMAAKSLSIPYGKTSGK